MWGGEPPYIEEKKERKDDFKRFEVEEEKPRTNLGWENFLYSTVDCNEFGTTHTYIHIDVFHVIYRVVVW